MYVEFRTSVPLYFEPQRIAILDVEATCTCYGEQDEEVPVAYAEFYIVDFGQILNMNENFFILMDDVHYTLMEISEIFYERGGIKEKFKKDTFGDDLIHLRKMLVKKEFRGCGIGRGIVDRAMRTFGKDGLITVMPFPAQHEESKPKDDFSDLTTSLSTAKKKLTDAYKKWGFNKSPKIKYLHCTTNEWDAQNKYIPPDLDNIPDKTNRLRALLKREENET